MTLNFTCHNLYPPNPSEVGITERKEDSWGRIPHFNLEYFGIDMGDNEEDFFGSVLRLPVDPFGMMNITGSSRAITGEVENSDSVVENEKRNPQIDLGNGFDRSNPSARFEQVLEENDLRVGSSDARRQTHVSDCKGKGIVIFNNEDSLVIGNRNGEFSEGASSSSSGDGEAPNEGLMYALSYLSIQDLLSTEMVCRIMCSVVRDDSLLWRDIHIDHHPLNEKVTDDSLLQLANRAQGNLQSLSLVECCKITCDGLKRVLESNPRITKLNVPGCTRLTIEGLVNCLNAFKTIANPGIKQLRVGGVYGMALPYFEKLNSLIVVDESVHLNSRKPMFFRKGSYYLPYDDDRAIDVETCPKCDNLRLIYDCPAEGCQEEKDESQLCRACIICIPRCRECGRCVTSDEFEETFCLDLNCSDCKYQNDSQEGDK